MFRNYLLVASRHLLGSKLFSLINVVGLAVGFTSFMLIGLYVRDELGFDQHYANSDRIYRLSRDVQLNDGSPDIYMAGNGPLEAGLFRQEFETVEQAARLRPLRIDVSRDNNSFAEQAAFADGELFAVFNFQWLRGDPATALSEPFSVVISESTAQKYFGTNDVLGQTLTLQGQYPAQVAGVIADLTNTHLAFDMLVSMPTATTLLGANALQNPTINFYHTYVMLQDGAEMAAIEAQVPALYERLYGEGASAVWGLTAMPLRDIHLRSHREGELSQPGSTSAIYAFSAIAVVILLLACFNFMNLATARGIKRAKEVGVRKALGAERGQMMMQFISEAMLTAGVAMALSVLLIEALLPVFNAFLQRELAFALSGAVWMPLLVVIVGFIAGSYPAFYLSSFVPSKVLKGTSVAGKGAATLRSCLVVLQFSIAIVLLVATGVVFMQLRYAQTIELGYSKEQVVVLNAPGRDGLGRQWDALKNRMRALPGVEQVTASNVVPGSSVGTNYFVRYEGSPEQRTMPVLLVDFGFFETYGMQLASGRSFSDAQDAERGLNNPAYFINELAARQLGWTPEEAIGKSFEVTCCNFGTGTIVGVVSDVYFESLRTPLAPTVYVVPPEPAELITAETRLGLRQASIAIAGDNVQQTLSDLRSVWAEFFPGIPANLRFLNDDFVALYQVEERQNRMLFTFSALAILIACLGLYGLASFNAERRMKEIGVRKVMGGSVLSIVVLLTNDFSRLVLISNVIAWPVAWYAMNVWLRNFAYRIDVTPLIFIGSGLVALCIAWVTVGGTAAKAASAKPVMALRYE